MPQLRVTIITILAFIAFGCGNNPVQNFSLNSAKHSEKEELSESPVYKDITVSILVDKTDSAHEEILVSKIEEIKNLLETLRPSKVSVIAFGADGRSGWYANEQATLFPKPNQESFDEVALRNKYQKECNLRKNCVDAQIAKAKSKVKTDNQQAEQTYYTQLKTAVEEVASNILRKPDIEPACTDLNEVGDRMAEITGDVEILITDGKHDCKSKLRTIDFSNKKILVLLLPLKDAKSDHSFPDRLKTIRSAFSGAKAIPFITADAKAMESAIR